MKESDSCHFGEHLMLDGYGGDSKKLSDRELVLSILNDLPGRLGMTKLSDPEVYFAPGNNGKDPGGWSGFVVIAESHISIHTFPARGFLSVDAYTCRNGMDCGFITAYFKERFGLGDVEEHFVKRGKRYPAENIG
ncbi:MAG: S-adenosylmethionine decarboxylase proenzyme [Candidatus Moranbacteria bacterium]|nr:S-adenosylmethionine decarboxylase proenzyme [Candidatus Moranbacteria bacterium]